jgi:hypothetical protein
MFSALLLLVTLATRNLYVPAGAPTFRLLNVIKPPDEDSVLPEIQMVPLKLGLVETA